MCVQAAQVEPGRLARLHRARHLVYGKAELGVRLAGLDVGADGWIPGVTRIRTRTGRARRRSISSNESTTMCPTPLSTRNRARPETCCCRACRAARPRSRRPAPGAARLLRPRPPRGPPTEQPVRRRAGRPCSRRSPRSARCRAKGLDESSRPRAHVVLGVHVGRRAELARQLERIAAADLKRAALVQARAEGIYVRDAPPLP